MTTDNSRQNNNMEKHYTKLVFAALSAATLMACNNSSTTGNTPEADSDSVVTLNTDVSIEIEEDDTPKEIIEEKDFSVAIPKGWTVRSAENVIEVNKPYPENNSRFFIFTQSLAFDVPLEQYIESHDFTADKKLGECTIGDINWVAYDKADRGYPVVYLTSIPSTNGTLCVRAFGSEVEGLGNPDVEKILRGIKLK